VFGSPQVGTAASPDYNPDSVAGKGFYDTPYGRISAKASRPGDVFTIAKNNDPKTGVQNTLTNPTIENANKLLIDQTDTLRQKYPLIFEEDTEQNKAYVADFNTAIPNYKDLNDFDKLKARNRYMLKMEDNSKYAKPPSVLPPGTPSAPKPDITIPD
jgi:hypothetical protein